MGGSEHNRGEIELPTLPKPPRKEDEETLMGLTWQIEQGARPRFLFMCGWIPL